MFGIGYSELIVIGIILIVAVGPSRMPGMLKAVVRAYREFRRATRDLRASTGIDEILQDEELRSLRKPLHVPNATKPVEKKRFLGQAERAQESPPDGVDIADIRDRERQPSPEEAARIRAAKDAAAALPEGGEDEARAKKLAAAREDERVRAAKLAAIDDEDEDEGERIRAQKIAAARLEDDGEDEDDGELARAKIAASHPDEGARKLARTRGEK